MDPGKKHNGTLYVVATPIGNLEDITFRAVRILKEVDLIAAEDTRHSRNLLAHFDIHTPLLSYFKDKEKERAGQIVAKLVDGVNVALISDAGTPGISDPGAILVRAAAAAGLAIVPVPGPSALTAALSVAGFDHPPFVFYGFLPPTAGRRRKFLAGIAPDEKTGVFYESPKRIMAALADCLELLGDRQMFMARELTKVHEETISGPVSVVLAVLAGRGQVKGEFVVVVAGAGPAAKPDEADVEELLRRHRGKKGLTLRDAVRRVSEELGAPRGEVYKKALAIWEKD